MLKPIQKCYDRVKYSNLKAKQKEIFNFQKASAALADYGFQCLLIADDWNGADFLAYHMINGDTLKVQLKGRVTIKRDYIGKGLWIMCPAKWESEPAWLMIPHDVLWKAIRKTTPTFEQSESWTGPKGVRSMAKPSKELQWRIKEWVL